MYVYISICLCVYIYIYVYMGKKKFPATKPPPKLSPQLWTAVTSRIFIETPI